MGKNLVETLIRAAVLVVAVVFIVYAYNRSGVATVEGYEVIARFSSVEDLNVGADELIPPGGEIKVTQSSINLEGLLGKFIYGGGGE